MLPMNNINMSEKSDTFRVKPSVLQTEKLT